MTAQDEWLRFEFSMPKPTVYVSGLLYFDPKRGRLYNLWLRWTLRPRLWWALRHARGATS